MAGILGAASIPFIGCVCLLVAMVLQILSFASPYWAEVGERDFGLWKWEDCEELDRAINGRSGEEGCASWDQIWDVSAWLEAVRAMEALAIIFWSIPMVVLPVYIYVALGLYYRCLMLTMTVLTFLGAVCNIVGVIVFAIELDKKSWDLGWCLVVCGIAFVPGLIASIVFLVAFIKRPTFSPERHYVSGFYVDPDKNRMYVVESVEPPPSAKGGNSVWNGGFDNPALAVQ